MANDADGMADKAIQDPGGVATAVAQAPADVIVRSQVKGGGMLYSLLLLSCLALLYSRAMRVARKLLAVLALWLLSQSGMAADFSTPSEKKFYANLSWYQASGSQQGRDLATGVSNAGIDITLSTYEVDRSAYQLQLGYRYHKYLALQLGYLDLGNIDVNFTVATNDTQALSNALSIHYPISCDGWALSNRFQYHFSSHFSASLDAGIYSWDSKVELSGLSIAPQLENGADPLLGVNFDHAITDRTTVGLGFHRVFFDKQTVDLWGGNISLAF